MQRCVIALTAAALLLGAVRATQAQNINDKIEIGQKAPGFKNLPGVDGRTHSLSDFTKGAKCTVVVITCNHCPVAVAYEDRIIDFVKDYASKGVKLVAVNVNNLQADKLPAMKVRARDKSFNFPYLYDSSQAIGRELGAGVTPEFFVIDAAGKIVFTGGMDDSMNPDKVTKQHLRDAVDAVLAGKPVPVAKVERRGCSVKYDN